MKMYAIIEASGQQLQVEPGRFYNVENALTHFFPSEFFHFPSENFLLYRVLMIRYASQTILGQPWIHRASIQGRLLQSSRNHKIIVYKMQPKKKPRRKIGYRHAVVRFVIDAIDSSYK